MFLYFIKGGDAIKVGITANLEQRLIDIQTGNPSKIELLHSISMLDEEARQAESEIHRMFIKTNLSGEWYQATQFMLDYIRNVKKTDGNLIYRGLKKSMKIHIERY